MPSTFVCSHCGVAGIVHFDRGAIQTEYSYDDWSRRCAYPDADGLAACPNLRETLQRLLIQAARRPNGRSKQL
jgi:YD repeat-containing protein